LVINSRFFSHKKQWLFPFYFEWWILSIESMISFKAVFFWRSACTSIMVTIWLWYVAGLYWHTFKEIDPLASIWLKVCTYELLAYHSRVIICNLFDIPMHVCLILFFQTTVHCLGDLRNSFSMLTRTLTSEVNLQDKCVMQNMSAILIHFYIRYVHFLAI